VREFFPERKSSGKEKLNNPPLSNRKYILLLSRELVILVRGLILLFRFGKSSAKWSLATSKFDPFPFVFITIPPPLR